MNVQMNEQIQKLTIIHKNLMKWGEKRFFAKLVGYMAGWPISLIVYSSQYSMNMKILQDYFLFSILQLLSTIGIWKTDSIQFNSIIYYSKASKTRLGIKKRQKLSSLISLGSMVMDDNMWISNYGANRLLLVKYYDNKI